jgi:FAD/FMN-containing dehydrogenase
VLVDLGKRMNRILDVSEEDATVLLEPGVQYMTVRRGACLASLRRFAHFCRIP